MHEDSSAMKLSKIKMLTFRFESIRMQEEGTEVKLGMNSKYVPENEGM